MEEDCHFLLLSLLLCYSKFSNKHVFIYYCGNLQKILNVFYFLMDVLVTIMQVQVSKLCNYQQFREVVLKPWSPEHCTSTIWEPGRPWGSTPDLQDQKHWGWDLAICLNKPTTPSDFNAN